MQYLKKKNKEMIDRFYLGEVPRKGVWFRYGSVSILNVGRLMETALPKWQGFNGWEAILENGEIIRKQKLNTLINHLK